MVNCDRCGDILLGDLTSLILIIDGEQWVLAVCQSCHDELDEKNANGVVIPGCEHVTSTVCIPVGGYDG